MADAHLGVRIFVDRVAHLSEEQRLTERGGEIAVVLSEVHCVERCACRRYREVHAVRAVLVVAFVRSEEMHLVLHDRAADADGCQSALVVRLAESREIVGFVAALKAVERDHAFVLISEERIAFQVLPPDFVVAVMIALEAFWYSALKFWLMTRYSWIALRGNGFPRLASWPALPPEVRSFLRLVPSIKRLTALAGWPPAEKVRNCALTRSSVTVMPGVSAARSRKLRLGVGSLSICAVVTFVATSEVRVSAVAAASTYTVRAARPVRRLRSLDLRGADLHYDNSCLRRAANAADRHLVGGRSKTGECVRSVAAGRSSALDAARRIAELDLRVSYRGAARRDRTADCAGSRLRRSTRGDERTDSEDGGRERPAKSVEGECCSTHFFSPLAVVLRDIVEVGDGFDCCCRLRLGGGRSAYGAPVDRRMTSSVESCSRRGSWRFLWVMPCSSASTAFAPRSAMATWTEVSGGST